MRDINIKEIIDLATQEVSNSDAELKQVYEWYHERKVMIIKGTISISVSLIIALAISYYKSEIKITSWSLAFPVCISLLTMSYGVYELYQIRKTSKKYIAAITLLSKLKKIRPFLTLYRDILSR